MQKANELDWSVEAITQDGGCASGKKVITDINSARVAQRRMEGLHKSKMDVYKCPRCNGWHVGNKKTAQKDDDGYITKW